MHHSTAIMQETMMASDYIHLALQLASSWLNRQIKQSYHYLPHPILLAIFNFVTKEPTSAFKICLIIQNLCPSLMDKFDMGQNHGLVAKQFVVAWFLNYIAICWSGIFHANIFIRSIPSRKIQLPMHGKTANRRSPMGFITKHQLGISLQPNSACKSCVQCLLMSVIFGSYQVLPQRVMHN